MSTKNFVVLLRREFTNMSPWKEILYTLLLIRPQKMAMHKLTQKEEEVMEFIWQLGNASPKDVLGLYDAPKPSINTVATSFQSLERKGYLRHEAEGRGYRYFPLIEQRNYGKEKFRSFVSRYFTGSYTALVSAFIKDEDVSKEELLALLDELENS